MPRAPNRNLPRLAVCSQKRTQTHSPVARLSVGLGLYRTQCVCGLSRDALCDVQRVNALMAFSRATVPTFSAELNVVSKHLKGYKLWIFITEN